MQNSLARSYSPMIINSEREAIDDLRTIVPNLTLVDDGYVIRWLRSRNGRFDETADALKKHIVFRKAWDLNNIDEWHAPELLEKYCGYGFLPDKDGYPILISLLGNLDVEGMVKSVQASDYIKFSLAAIERGINLCNEKCKENKRPFEQMMLIFDLDHIGNAHYSCKSFAASFTTLVLLFQEHYPLVLKKILIIRAPEMARVAFNAMMPFLNDIQELIEMPSIDDWQNQLEKYVDVNSWPVHWGGNLRDENGDPKCPSKVRYGLGPIPDSYYVDPEKSMPDYDHLTTVYAGEKHLIEIKVNAAGTKISWQYMTSEEDIGFAIRYDGSGKANNLVEMETVFPYIRLECSHVPCNGSLMCEKAGRWMCECLQIHEFSQIVGVSNRIFSISNFQYFV